MKVSPKPMLGIYKVFLKQRDLIISNICNVNDKILPVVYKYMYNTPALESALCGVKQSISLCRIPWIFCVSLEGRSLGC